MRGRRCKPGLRSIQALPFAACVAAILSSDNPTFVAGRERNIEGMRMAGVPEG